MCAYLKQTLLCIIVLVFTLTSPDASSGELSIGTAFEPPLSDSAETGALDLIIREAFARIGTDVNFVRLPAERSLINANLGIIDGDLVRVEGMKDMYPNLVQVPEKLLDFKFVGFSRNVQPNTTHWNSLKGYSVGFVCGWKILEKNIPKDNVTYVENADLLFTLLAKDRVDIIIHELYQGKWMAARKGITGLHILQPPLATKSMYLYLHTKHKDIIPRLRESLMEMKNDGTYEQIINAAFESVKE